MVSISTYGGWAGIVLIGAGYWYLQSKRTTSRTNRFVPQKQAKKSGDARKDGKSKKNRSEGAQSGGEQGNSTQEKGQKKKKQKTAHSIVEETTPVDTTSGHDTNEDDHANIQEFARQFQNAKSGTITLSRPQASSRPKSVKQSQAKDTSRSNNSNGTETSSNDVSKASSTAGRDDDDLSAANSPALGPTQMKMYQSGDVSDMLESPPPGPSILRIIEPAASSKPKKEQKPTRSSEVIETKKQRQNRKKAEARKEAREEKEKERRILLEKQRRIAREAEGRAAKNGSNFIAAKAATSSAWTAPPTIMNGHAASTAKNVELLDTYELTTNEVSNSSTARIGSDKNTDSEWDKAIPSEEEQMRLLEEEMAWNTVTSRKGKKKGAESEQVLAQKSVENEKLSTNGSKDTRSKTTPTNAESKSPGSVTIVGDPSIDISSFSYKGGPVNAVLENGDGKDYGYTMMDDEWEVA